MILFITGQYAGAEYLHPLFLRWLKMAKSPEWKLLATGASSNYWDKTIIPYDTIVHQSSAEVEKYLNKLNPSLLVISASSNIDLEHIFILAAKKKGLTCACYIDTWSNYRSRFQYLGKELYPDYVLAIDERCANESIAEGIPQNIIHIVGQPYLENIIDNTPELGKKILLASQPINKNFGKSLGYDEVDFWNICIKSYSKFESNGILATIHPDEKTNNYQFNDLNVTWVRGQGMKDVQNSHTVLGMSSMQMIIGYLWGRKVASVQPNLLVKDPSPLSRWGLIPRFERFEEVDEFLATEDKNSCDQKFKNNFKNSLNRFESFCLSSIT
jgi:hypothetical protein